MVKFSDQVQWAFSRTLGKSEAGILLGFSTTYIAEQGFCQVLHTRKYRLDMNKIGKTPYDLNQGSPTFLKLRATSCVPIDAKGY